MILNEDLEFEFWVDPYNYDYTPLRELGYSLDTWNDTYILFKNDEGLDVMFFEPGDFHCDSDDVATQEAAAKIDREIQEAFEYKQELRRTIIQRTSERLKKYYDKLPVSETKGDISQIEEVLEKYSVSYEFTDEDVAKLSSVPLPEPKELIEQFRKFHKEHLEPEMIYGLLKFLNVKVRKKEKIHIPNHFNRVQNKENLTLGALYAVINDTYSTLRLHHAITIARHILYYDLQKVEYLIIADDLVQIVEKELMGFHRKSLSSARLLRALIEHDNIDLTEIQHKNIAKNTAVTYYLFQAIYTEGPYERREAIEIITSRDVMTKEQ